MKITCENCKNIFNFKTEKLPDKAFSFHCTTCREKIWVTEEEIVDTKHKHRNQKKKKTIAKKRPLSPPGIEAAMLKKPVMKFVGIVSRLSGRSERYWLMSLTKFAALFSIAALIALIIAGGVTLFSLTYDTEVTFAELERTLYLKKDPTLTIRSAVPGIVIPDRVKKTLGSDYREQFVDWMNGLENHQKADFIDNLDRVIKQAQISDPAHIHDYINEYKHLKYSRSVKKPYSPYLFQIAMMVLLMAMIALLGLFCLVMLQLTWQQTVSVTNHPKPSPTPRLRQGVALRKTAV